MPKGLSTTATIPRSGDENHLLPLVVSGDLEGRRDHSERHHSVNTRRRLVGGHVPREVDSDVVMLAPRVVVVVVDDVRTAEKSRHLVFLLEHARQ